MARDPNWKTKSTILHEDGRRRCLWAGDGPLMQRYHDKEWGRPLHDDVRLFEMLCLEGAQAGLSWSTILNKRESYRAAFDHFDAEKMARYKAEKIRKLLGDPGIVRNRLKVAAFVSNARALLDLREHDGSFNRYLWKFTDGRPIRNRWKSMGQIPVSTAESDALSKDLKQRGFKFVGTTICYAFMQAVGMVDDHMVDCWAKPKKR